MIVLDLKWSLLSKYKYIVGIDMMNIELGVVASERAMYFLDIL